MKKLLITGGAGFIGSHLVETLQEGYQVVVLDDLSEGTLENLQGLDYQFIKGSILDTDLLSTAIKSCDFVIHLAGMSSVEKSNKDSRKCLQQNVTGLLNVADAAVKNKVKKLVFASSSSVYGNAPTLLKSEKDVPRPASPYAITKLAGEHFLQGFSETTDLSCASLRLFNVFGPHQSPKGPYSSAIPRFIAQATKNEVIEVHGDGEQTRDFIHVSDVVAGFCLALESTAVEGVMNMGTGLAISINELVSMVTELSSSQSQITYSQSRNGDVEQSLADTSISSAYGFHPKITLRDGLMQMILP